MFDQCTVYGTVSKSPYVMRRTVPSFTAIQIEPSGASVNAVTLNRTNPSHTRNRITYNNHEYNGGYIAEWFVLLGSAHVSIPG